MSTKSLPNNEHENKPFDSGSQQSKAADAIPDPFDPAALRLGQDFAASVGVEKVLTTVRCRKPNRQEFVRVRPGESQRLETAVFEDKLNNETYLVSNQLRSELAGEIYPVCLFLATNRQGDVFLWPVKLPSSDGRTNSWNESALAAARLAETHWTRVAANMPAGLYDTFQAAGELSDPDWPDLDFRAILELCFRARLIDDIDHPVLKALRGE